MDPAQRLGANGVNEIKSHAFFRNFDWEALKNRTMESPIGSCDIYQEMFKKQYEKVCQNAEQEFEAIEQDFKEIQFSSPSVKEERTGNISSLLNQILDLSFDSDKSDQIRRITNQIEEEFERVQNKKSELVQEL